jgi:hypothetical protein
MDVRDNLPVAFPFEDFALTAFCDVCDRQAVVGRARLQAGLTLQRRRIGHRAVRCGAPSPSPTMW